MSSKILVIDDDTSFCLMLQTFLKKKGFDVVNAFTGREAVESIKSQAFDIILTDIRLPDSDGLQILKLTKETSFNTQVILMTGYTDIKVAVKSIKLGAFDYVGKPINPDEILYSVESALKKKKEDKKNKLEFKKTKKRDSIPFIKGISEHSKELYEYVSLVAPTNMSVLIVGDSGTGKEHIAKEIHIQSKRTEEPFIAVDCGAISTELAASEFFGHIKGSFTGAINNKIGHFEAANKGTIFLDEIGNLSYEVQVKLLRVLQERKIKPIGGNTETEVDIRVIAATNEDLSEAVKRGDFREDLYHRLNEFYIKVPRLSERKHDLMIFANHFLELANNDLGKLVIGFSPEVVKLFNTYDWPGNLREMKNIIKRSVLLTKSELINLDVLPQEMLLNIEKDNSFYLYSQQNEQEAILQALYKTGYNKTKTAILLGIDRKTLYNKLKLYNINSAD